MLVNEVHVHTGMRRKSQFELFTVKKQEDLDFPGSPLSSPQSTFISCIMWPAQQFVGGHLAFLTVDYEFFVAVSKHEGFSLCSD